MRKIKNIVISDLEPSKEDIWIKEDVIKIYGNNGWKDLTTDVVALNATIKKMQEEINALKQVPKVQNNEVKELKKEVKPIKK